METYLDRIVNTAKEKGVSHAHLTRKMGTYRTRLAECRTGRSTLTDDEIQICAAELGVTAEWIKTGELNIEQLMETIKTKYIQLSETNRMMANEFLDILLKNQNSR